MSMFRSRFRSRMTQQVQAPAPGQAQPAPVAQAPQQAAPQPAPAPQPAAQQGPSLADAIARLKAGDRAGGEAIMRQIVGLPPVNQNPVTTMPAPTPGIINRNIPAGPAPGQSYKDYMDNRMKSYDPYAIGKNR